jgi:hypothetical protein
VANGLVPIVLSTSETDCDVFNVRCVDASGDEWIYQEFSVYTSAQTFDTTDGVADAIKAKTDNLPADPADDSDIDSQLAAIAAYVDTEVAAILAAVDTEVAAIKAKTDNLPSDPADQSAVEAAITSATSGLATAAAVADLPTNAELTAALAGADDATLAAIAALNDITVADIWAGLGDTEKNAIADAILSRSVVNVEDTAGVHSLTELILAAFESSIAGTDWTINQTDHTTPFNVRSVTVDANAEPITGVQGGN